MYDVLPKEQSVNYTTVCLGVSLRIVYVCIGEKRVNPDSSMRMLYPPYHSLGSHDVSAEEEEVMPPFPYLNAGTWSRCCCTIILHYIPEFHSSEFRPATAFLACIGHKHPRTTHTHACTHTHSQVITRSMQQTRNIRTSAHRTKQSNVYLVDCCDGVVAYHARSVYR
jgi:hypothetical protein